VPHPSTHHASKPATARPGRLRANETGSGGHSRGFGGYSCVPRRLIIGLGSVWLVKVEGPPGPCPRSPVSRGDSNQADVPKIFRRGADVTAWTRLCPGLACVR
jgi:hypothetical protein